MAVIVMEQINNIYYKLGDGPGYESTPIRVEKKKLDENMVDWSLFSSRASIFVNTRTAISCPFSCAFCGFPEHAGKYQAVDVECVEKELNQLEKIKGFLRSFNNSIKEKILNPDINQVSFRIINQLKKSLNSNHPDSLGSNTGSDFNREDDDEGMMVDFDLTWKKLK
jgi:hypothetical protein